MGYKKVKDCNKCTEWVNNTLKGCEEWEVNRISAIKASLDDEC